MLPGQIEIKKVLGNYSYRYLDIKAVPAAEKFSYTQPYILQPSSLSLLLCSRRLGLCRLLLVAIDHDYSDKCANDSGAQKGKEHGDADGPNARGEEGMERVAGVDKRLS
jgi:hypothetical protein